MSYSKSFSALFRHLDKRCYYLTKFALEPISIHKKCSKTLSYRGGFIFILTTKCLLLSLEFVEAKFYHSNLIHDWVRSWAGCIVQKHPH